MSRTRDFLLRVTTPALGPIGGRVADINRRVDDTRRSVEQHGVALESALADLAQTVADIHADSAKLRQTVDNYADALAESTSLTGVELRRLADLVSEVAGLTPGGLVPCPAAARDPSLRPLGGEPWPLALEALDDDLAALCNHAASHRGYAAQARLWFNPPVTVELRRASARAADVNERIVEVPFASAALARLKPPASILDVGSAESTFALSAASLGYRVTAVDPNLFPFDHRNLESIATRFEDWDPGDRRFDAVFLISAIEHFGRAGYGIGTYGDTAGPGSADRVAMARVSELLNPGGFVVVTTPYGRREVNEPERRYDDGALRELLAGWEVLERRIVVRRDRLTWRPAEHAEEVQTGVAMLVATPTPAA